MEKQESPERATYTVDQAAKLTGVARNTMYEAVHAGEIASIRIGRRILIPRVALGRMLAGESRPGAWPGK